MIWQNLSYSLQVNIQNKKVYNCNKTDKFLLISAHVQVSISDNFTNLQPLFTKFYHGSFKTYFLHVS